MYLLLQTDFGVDCLAELVEKTTFPWLMSNVIDKETNAPLGDGKVTCILEKNGKKIGLVNLPIIHQFGHILCAKKIVSIWN